MTTGIKRLGLSGFTKEQIMQEILMQIGAIITSIVTIMSIIDRMTSKGSGGPLRKIISFLALNNVGVVGKK